jgi:hypothetical protein
LLDCNGNIIAYWILFCDVHGSALDPFFLRSWIFFSPPGVHFLFFWRASVLRLSLIFSAHFHWCPPGLRTPTQICVGFSLAAQGLQSEPADLFSPPVLTSVSKFDRNKKSDPTDPVEFHKIQQNSV